MVARGSIRRSCRRRICAWDLKKGMKSEAVRWVDDVDNGWEFAFAGVATA